MIIIEVVLGKKLGKKMSFVNIYFPPFTFRKATGHPLTDWLNLLGKSTEQIIFIPYVCTYLKQTQQSKHKS